MSDYDFDKHGETNVFDGQFFIINSEKKLGFFLEHFPKLWEQNKHITVKWKLGTDRSLSQNSLFHVWASQYAAHLACVPVKGIDPELVEGMKDLIKREVYNETAWEFLVKRKINPKTREVKLAFASSADWGTGGMFNVLTWLQARALQNDNLILESKGEYADLVRKRNGLDEC